MVDKFGQRVRNCTCPQVLEGADAVQNGKQRAPLRGVHREADDRRGRWPGTAVPRLNLGRGAA